MLSWKVIWDDINKHEIGTYDLFKSGYWERVARELKQTFPNRKEWGKALSHKTYVAVLVPLRV